MFDRVEIDLSNPDGGIKKSVYSNVSDVYYEGPNLILCIGDLKQQIQVHKDRIKKIIVKKQKSNGELNLICD